MIMETSSTFSSFLFLCVLVLSDISLAISLNPGTKLKNAPENNNHLQNQEMWLQQPRTGRHHRQRLAKKERVHTMPSRGEETFRMGSGASAVEELVAEAQPAALKQNKDVFLGFELSYPERENQSPGSEKGKKQNREHRRHSRRDRLKHHQGIWAPREAGAVVVLEMSISCVRAKDAAVVEPHGCVEGVECAPALGRNLPNKRGTRKKGSCRTRILVLAAILWKWPSLSYRGNSERP